MKTAEVGSSYGMVVPGLALQMRIITSSSRCWLTLVWWFLNDRGPYLDLCSGTSFCIVYSSPLIFAISTLGDVHPCCCQRMIRTAPTFLIPCTGVAMGAAQMRYRTTRTSSSMEGDAMSWADSRRERRNSDWNPWPGNRGIETPGSLSLSLSLSLPLIDPNCTDGQS